MTKEVTALRPPDYEDECDAREGDADQDVAGESRVVNLCKSSTFNSSVCLLAAQSVTCTEPIRTSQATRMYNIAIPHGSHTDNYSSPADVRSLANSHFGRIANRITLPIYSVRAVEPCCFAREYFVRQYPRMTAYNLPGLHSILNPRLTLSWRGQPLKILK